jgi:hypothetical protein
MSASIAYLGPHERALSDFLRRWIKNGRLVISKRRGKEAEQEEAGVYSENAEVESKTIQWRKK